MLMQRPTTRLRSLLKREKFVYFPVAFNSLVGRLIESLKFKAFYVGGNVTGSSLCSPEPLLTMDEQVRFASGIATAARIPALVDAGAGFGEPLHTMRTVREFIGGGIGGIHIEDQVFPKRAHYHKNVSTIISLKDFTEKMKMACRQRDALDRDFLIVARSDACSSHNLQEAIKRINKATEVGADLGLCFPTSPKDAERAPKLADVPLLYVQSRGNRKGRPLYTNPQLEQMGYKGCIDASFSLYVSYYHLREALREMKETGEYTALDNEKFLQIRKEIEDLIGLEEYYQVEEATL